MNKSKDSILKTKTTAFKIGIVIAAALVVSLGAFYLYNLFFFNPAQETASRIESALIANGAIKKCTSGDAGRGPDNMQPHYSARFQLLVGKEDAKKLIYKIAEENGYSLSHQDSPYDSIEWYKDETTNSPYAELESGKVSLGLSTYNDTKNDPLTCLDGTVLQGDDSHTALSLSIGLPARK
jgi:hypothetical protein